MYLQPTSADRGALRVIPGSYKDPMHAELLRIGLNIKPGQKKSQYLEKSGLNGEDIPCYIFSSNPGDIITLNELIWHAAYRSYKDRRLCYFNFYRNPKTPEQTVSMRKEVDKLAVTKRNQKIGGLQYHPWWLKNPDNNPRRARWINWLTEWGFIDAGNILN